MEEGNQLINMDDVKSASSVGLQLTFWFSGDKFDLPTVGLCSGPENTRDYRTGNELALGPSIPPFSGKNNVVVPSPGSSERSTETYSTQAMLV
ncbi:hypothetical protein MTR67_001303 [Solanum verrucosum]|uniref:Uncharacterized protein n=1 Tax=Solanum verrucosum TaxID=315347 RepID=A0AAF0PN03_SOLVR|nr:hypothetical protein MTR67_001303 [Solanum verrucosum]